MHGYAARTPGRFDTRASIFSRPADFVSLPTLGARYAKEMRCHLRNVNRQRREDFFRAQPSVSWIETPRRRGRRDTSSHTPHTAPPSHSSCSTHGRVSAQERDCGSLTGHEPANVQSIFTRERTGLSGCVFFHSLTLTLPLNTYKRRA